MAVLDLRSLKTLLWAKRRRLEGLEAEVKAAAAGVAQAEAALVAARSRHQDCVREVQDCEQRIEQMVSSPRFVPQDAVTFRHVLETLQGLAMQAEEGVRTAQAQRVQAQAVHDGAKGALQRAQQQIEQLEDRRQRRLVELDQAAEDTQDEESEEAAVARRLAQARAAVVQSAEVSCA